MGNIPLPALDVRTPGTPNIMDQYASLLKLQNMRQNVQQQQQMAPLQMQQQQQATQAGALQLQQQQQQANDQKAMTAAMQAWDGKSYDDLSHLALKNGASGAAAMNVQQQAIQQKTQAANLALTDAKTGQANVEAQMKKNDMIAGPLGALVDPKQTPDAQLPQAIAQTAQQLQQSGLLDPQHLQTAQQLAQTAQANPGQARQALDAMRKGLMANSQILDEAKERAATAASQSTADKNQAESNYYAQNGGAPGVPVEAQQQADWLKKNPGKGPSDFAAWKAKLSPFAVVMGNQLGGNQNSDALDLAAQNYRLTGQMPSGLSRSPGTTTAIIARAAQLDQSAGGAGIAGNKAVLQANTKSLDNLQKNYDTVQAFEGTASRNIDLLQQTAAKIPDLGARFANVPVRMLNSKMLGTQNMAAFNTALNTAQTEAAKVLNSSNASGVLSDSARHELQQIVDGNMPYKSMVASLNTLKQDMANRTQAYQAQIGDIQNRIKGAGSSAATNPGSGAAGSGAPGGPTPQTHVFSLSAWQKANPQGDPKAALAAAQQAHYQVTQ